MRKQKRFFNKEEKCTFKKTLCKKLWPHSKQNLYVRISINFKDTDFKMFNYGFLDA